MKFNEDILKQFNLTPEKEKTTHNLRTLTPSSQSNPCSPAFRNLNSEYCWGFPLCIYNLYNEINCNPKESLLYCNRRGIDKIKVKEILVCKREMVQGKKIKV